MRRIVAQNIALLTVTMIVILLMIEITLRFVSHTNADNNTFIKGKMLKPYNFPFHVSKNSENFYLNNVDKKPSKAQYVYDKFLGWNANPNMNDTYNEQGILGPNKIFTIQPKDDILRIALFGDSMTRSSGHGYEKSWGYLLEKNLTELGYNVEVMNFGVGGYGIDQMYLRWEIEGKKYSPHLVIFGFYSLDIARCLEVHKLKNWGLTGGVLFSKPRFLIGSDSSITEIINYPTISLEKLLHDTKSFDDLPYIQYDTVYLENKSDYKNLFWRNSYLLRFIEANLADNRFTQISYKKDSQYYDTKKEGAKLALEIIRKFQSSVQEENSNFFTIVLPGMSDLLHLKNGKPLIYINIIDMIEKFSPMIHAEKKMKDYDDIKKFYIPNDGHFSSLGNEIIAKILSEYLAENFDQLRGRRIGGAAQPSRSPL